jgi:hypothetical protein
LTISAVLPLTIRGSYDVDDLHRADILFQSLTTFAAPGTFSSFLIVTPPDETTAVERHYARWSELPIRVISEEVLVPELAAHRHVRGWRKQQMVKLAAARQIEEDFFLTLDADVIALRPFSVADLIIDERALIQYELRSQHPKWWRSSARLLDMDPDVGDAEIGMTVTPALLSRDLCLRVAEALAPDGKGTWVDRLCRLHNPRAPSNWTLGRFLRSKWTEYSLYYLCAMKYGLLDRYHVRAGTAEIPQRLLVHDAHPFEEWMPAETFAADSPGLFCVVGSKSRIDVAVVWEKVKPFIR